MNEKPNPILSRPEYEAEVVDDNDPKGLMRVKVRVLGLQDDVPAADLSWATYKLPVGHRPGDGDFMPAQKGDIVWVDFPYISHGQPDTRRPRITGSVHFCPEGNPNFPQEAWKGPDSLQHKRTDRQPDPDAAQYHKAKVLTIHGVTVEIEPNGAHRLTQRASGTSTEITKEGHLVHHVEGDIYHSCTGNLLFEVDGDVEWDVKGRIIERATQHIAGKRK